MDDYLGLKSEEFRNVRNRSRFVSVVIWSIDDVLGLYTVKFRSDRRRSMTINSHWSGA